MEPQIFLTMKYTYLHCSLHNKVPQSTLGGAEY